MAGSHSPLTVSVIIPVYNGGDAFRWCLEDLERCQPAPSEIIVVSDGDSDGSWKVAQEFGAIVIRQENRGPAAARNLGARFATGDLLFFVDADVLVKTDTIGQVIRQFQTHPHLDALIGSYDDQPSQSNFMSQYRNLFHHYIHQCSSHAASTFWGACGAIRREVFLSVGGFDECYRVPCIEDIELGYRLHEAGYTLELVHTLQVKHMKKWRVSSVVKTDVVQRAIPWTTLLFQRRDRMKNDLNLRISHRVSAVCLLSLLISGAIALWYPLSLIIMSISTGLLLLLNRDLYQFFLVKRGLLFTLKAIPVHWLYYLYSSFAFLIGGTIHASSKCNSRNTLSFTQEDTSSSIRRLPNFTSDAAAVSSSDYLSQ